MTRLTSMTLYTAAALLVLGCADADANIDGLGVDPDSANKGDTLRVNGKVSSLDVLTGVTYTVTDDHGATAKGITVDAVALGKDKSSWNLHDDGQAKIVILADAASGKYHLKVEAKTDKKTNDAQADFTVR